jgi:hypothetical protein
VATRWGTLITEPLGQKRLELLLEMVSQTRVVGMLVDPSSRATEPDIMDVEAAAHAHQKQLNVFRAKSPMARMLRRRASRTSSKSFVLVEARCSMVRMSGLFELLLLL